ncbi:G/U mismatch-specific uracil-DNA glycosylase [Micromonospora mirobrigensis]|uniref:G/U mismatch-specific uracil-DNA glycosylase n=1 Tax=Micromonospora mirobrigensis TaxID=262898 RepID=A0A1C5AN97_9ACTN|nr:G/U mismatch-specific uracil-DNA glycosylase [Micromonospora mirobrigensis]
MSGRERPGSGRAGRGPARRTPGRGRDFAGTRPEQPGREPDPAGPGPEPAGESVLGRHPRPTREELAAAADRTLPDIIAPGLDVLFVGINPGLWSAATGWHFARPGNRFWPALHRGGFTPRQLHPSEQDELPGHGLGITNMVARASARDDELTAAELLAGAEILTDKVRRYRPRWVAVVGVTAYRIGFARPKAGFGPQPEPLRGALLWVLPNPSGLNAHFTPATLGAAFAELHAATGR